MNNVTSQRPDGAIHRRVDPAELYFAVLDASLIGASPTPTSRQLGFLFEALLPVPLETIHAVYLKLGGASYLACGMDREDLSQLRGEGAVTLTPASVPEGLDAEVDLAALNLLTGDFEPPALAPIRRRLAWLRAAVLVAAAGLIATGFLRRSHAAEESMAAVMADRHEAIATVLGTAIKKHPHPELLVVGERRSLEKTRAVGVDDPLLSLERSDIALILQKVLARFPAEHGVRIESATLTDRAVTFNGQADTAEQAQLLASALAKTPGWSVQQPRFDAQKTGVNFTIRLAREEGKP